MRLRYKLAIFLLPVALVNGCLIHLASEHEPAEAGTSAEFWNYACGVELAAYPGWPKRSTYYGGVVPEIDGWFVYYRQRHHDRPLYRVARSEVASDLAEVMAALATPVDPNSRAANQERADDCAARLAGIDADEVDEEDVSRLIAGLVNGRLRSLESTDPERHARLERVYEGTAAQWRRGQRAWLSFLFEGLFLTGWILFIAWPWLCGGDGRRKAIHLGSAPLLLHVPYYLGYAPMTFTFGPPGGFLYPLFLRLGMVVTMLLPPTIIDFWILRSVPRILGPLSQVPGPPTAVTITSVGAPFLLGMLALAVITLATSGRSGRRRRLQLVFLWLLAAAAVAIPLGIVLVGSVWAPADGVTFLVHAFGLTVPDTW